MAISPIWLFDLDDTLHDASTHIFPHIDAAMTRYIAQTLGLSQEAANTLRVDYWRRFGATMLGLQRCHGISPHDFLARTHDIPWLLQHARATPLTRQVLRQLPGRKCVVSNGPQAYVQAMLRQLGLEKSFERVFGVEALGLIPKPAASAFRRVLSQLGASANQCVLVDDNLANLHTAKQMGMRTVWVARHQQSCPTYVDARIRQIRHLLRQTQVFKIRAASNAK